MRREEPDRSCEASAIVAFVRIDGWIGELRSLRGESGTGAAGKKLAILGALSRESIRDNVPGARERILRLAAELLFLRAHPDDERILVAVSGELSRFSERITPRLAKQLRGSGLPGTAIVYPFDLPVARWIRRRFPDAAELDWRGAPRVRRLQDLLPALAGAAEEIALVDEYVGTREWAEHARGDNSALAWLVDRLDALPLTARLRDALYDSLGIRVSFRVEDRASKTGACRLGAPIVFHSGPMFRHVPDLRAHLAESNVRSRRARGREAERLVDLARGALCVRSREMNPISNANPEDVVLHSLERGVEIVTYGVSPERRLLLESLWGFLILKNGVPVGYGSASLLFSSAEIAVNVFDEFRKGESAFIFAELLRILRHHFGAASFTLLESQFGGDGDEEGIRSGAFWFYDRLGFRHVSRELRGLAEKERKRLAAAPGRRSPPGLLRKLASAPLVFSLNEKVRSGGGTVWWGRLGVAATSFIAKEGRGDREKAMRTARLRVERALAERIPSDRLAGELCAVLSLLPDLPSWSGAEKRALAGIIGAKAGESEREFALKLSRHTRLEDELISLIDQEEPV